MTAGDRMSAADAAWLGLDRPEHLMVVTAVLRLRGRVELADLHELAAERLVAAHPKFRQRPIPSRVPLRLPVWRDDPDFEVTRQITVVELGAAETDLMTYVGELMGTPLDLTHAPWTLTLVHVGPDSAVIARVHHCLADGVALGHVLLAMADRADGPRSAAPATSSGGAAAPAKPRRHALRQLLSAAVRTLSMVLVGRKDSGSRLRGPASVGRRAAWTRPLDLAAAKEASRRLGVSVNDVLLAAVAGGLRHWLLDQGERPTDCRVMVPVDLRRGASVPTDLGNRFGIVFVTLPVSVDGREARVAAVRAATTAAKSSAVAPASYAMLTVVGVLPRAVQGFVANVLGRAATGIVTNVPGPRTALTLAGSPLTSVVFWVPHIGPVGIGVSIFSYAGTVTLGVATNSSLAIDPIELVTAVEAELAAISSG